jgi:probable phosphoglycerate mutase
MTAGRVVVEADGGARGNPGPAGYGALVRDAATGAVLAERAESLGVTTNNVAEYSGLIAGLEAAAALGAREVEVRMDSKLVIEQVSGRWQVKQPHLRPLARRATVLLGGFETVRLRWVPRAENAAADALANSAMDGTPVRRDHAHAVAVPRTVPAAGGPGWAAPADRPTTTVLVRHGASALSAERRFSGRGDVPLSAEGEAQARRVAALLAAQVPVRGFDAVVTSPLRRARSTAETLAESLGVELVVDDDLTEADFGAWEGLTFAQVRARWPELVEEWRASPDVAPPGGEAFSAVAGRVRAALDRLLAARPAGSVVVVVSHVTPLKTLLRIALDAPPSLLFRLQLDVGGVSEVDWYPGGAASVRLVNDLHHLA